MSNGKNHQGPAPPMKNGGQASHPMQKLRQAIALHQQGQLGQAEALYRDVLDVAPDSSDALHFLGVLESQRGREDIGLPMIERAVAINPANVSAHYNRGNILRDLERLDDALRSYDRVLALKADHIGALNNRGVILHDLGRYSEALVSYNHALAQKPDHADALCNRGSTQIELKRFEDALSSYERALAIAPGDVAAHFGRGNSLSGLARFEEALVSFDRALAIAPDDVRVMNNRGNVLNRLSRLDEALACFNQVAASDPLNADALNNRGNIFIQLKSYAEAVSSYDRALGARPDWPETLYGRGYALTELKRHDEAIVTFERLMEIKPDYPYALGMLLYAKRTACDWRDSLSVVSKTARAVKEGKRAVTPLAFLAVSDSIEDNARCSRILAADKFKARAQALWRGEHYGHSRIRVAYLSADFNTHAVATQMAGVFERRDKTRFETIALSHGLNDKSPMRTRLERAFDRFLDVQNMSDFDVASLIRKEEADIAVDLTGLTGRGRPGILAARPAGIQVQHLGFPGTMGADYFDYIVADRVVIPESQQRHYSEKVVYLPDTYLPNDRTRVIAREAPSRAEAGLPASGFVFCSFNNSYKFSPEIFDVWMRLLGAVSGAVLWLPEGNEAARRNLAREAQARGVDPHRLVFAGYAEAPEDHLARLALADVFLDTLPYNAHSTASDALWAGLPVLTCPGGSFAGRVAASQLHAAGLPELIADSLAAYEAMALRLARDAAMLAAVKAKLRQNRDSCPLFDTGRFTRHLEAAYTQMWELHRRGRAPEGFSVGASDASAS